MDKIKLTPLGGFGEIGKNLLIFEIDKKEKEFQLIHKKSKIYSG